MSILQINTRVRRLFQYLDDFEKGRIQIPPFQRDFVWDNQKKLDLLDSLKRGFPIGSVLFWQSQGEDLFLNDDIQKIGSYLIRRDGNEFYYILDGYQRLSTLFGCFMDPSKTYLDRDEDNWKKNFDIIYNLHEDRFEFNRKFSSDLQIYQIPLYHFIDGEKFYDFQTRLVHSYVDETQKKDYIKLYKNFGSKISSYDIPSIDLVGGDLKDAVEIFSRLNSRGVKISDDWKVSALSFNRERQFRFGSEIDALFVRLEQYNFFTSKEERINKRDLILKCVINSFGKIYFDISNVSNDLEALALRSDFIDISLETFSSIERAVKFLYEEVMVLRGSLLPYNNHLVFLTEFFNRVKSPTREQLDKLRIWFWKTTYSNYFTIYNLAKQRSAYYHFLQFIDDENVDPVFYDKNRQFETADFPKKISMNSVRAKALALFMLNFSVRGVNILTSQSIDSDTQLRFKDLKIFRRIDNASVDNIVENTLIILNPSFETLKFEKQNRVLLSSQLVDSNISRFLISSEMLNNISQEDFLERRLSLIKSQEREFVEQLGISYAV
ncbi:DUF262 domain-containing protein [Dyadobacter sp. OTU695]|uniref:DUF262 domain-containing protein n=1 Tax=Dyadobacter sp. OTU695 TaxID=3043860 RepID=UPI00313B271D